MNLLNLVRRILIVIIIVLSFFGVLELLTKYVKPANKSSVQHYEFYEVDKNLS